MDFFEGDWQVAANMYREWAISQKWCKDKYIPDKLKDIDLWRINHMNYDLGTRTQEYFDTSVRLKEELGCNLALHWYGWNMRQHDVNYPEYISDENVKKGWVEELKRWNEYLHVPQKGIDFFKQNKYIVIYGRLKAIPGYECKKISIKWEDGDTHYTKEYPAVMASEWEDKDGKVIYFLYNFDSCKQIVNIDGISIEVEPKSFKTVAA